jgi:hypothetical protein
MTFRNTLLGLAIASGWALRAAGAEPASGRDYRVRVTPGAVTEHRCYFGAHHFLSVLDDRGALAIRPHPGVDPNGWGSSLYLQPFLPGAVLGHTRVEGVKATGRGIEVTASGSASRGEKGTYGAWSVQISFQYDPAGKRVQGKGAYAITLDGSLSGIGDLNLLKIASNYLKDVPLLTGGKGDTGDMREAVVAGDRLRVTWNPPAQPAFFPQERTHELSINVSGQHNVVDTKAQGHQPIAAAYKPSLHVTLKSKDARTPMIFGAIYDAAKSRDFWEDNVGITPLVLASSALTRYEFDLAFSSEALPGDGPAGKP